MICINANKSQIELTLAQAVFLRDMMPELIQDHLDNFKDSSSHGQSVTIYLGQEQPNNVTDD